MTYVINQWESNASLRVIPLLCVQSNGTSVATNEAGGQPTFMVGGVYKGNTTNTLSAWSANAGEYFVTLAASDVSVKGQGVVRFSSTTAIETATAFVVVANDPFGTGTIVSSGKTLFACSTTTGTLNSGETGTNAWANGDFIAVQLHSGVVLGNIISASTGTLVQFQNAFPVSPASGDTYYILPGTADNFSGLSIAPAPGTYSNVTVQINGIAPGNYSGVTTSGVTTSNNLDKSGYGVTAIASGTYSGVTVGSLATLLAQDYSSVVTMGVGSIKVATYSGVTVGSIATLVPTDYSSKVTMGVGSITPNTYSGVTVGSLATIVPGDYSSSVTVGVAAIKANTYSGVTVGTGTISSAAAQANANSLLSTNMGNNRFFQDMFMVVRNKVDATGSTGTVYNTDDTTALFTFSYATASGGIAKLDPNS